MNSYIATHWAPVLVLLGGIVVVSVVLYLHVRQRPKAIRWTAKNIFRSQTMSEKSAESLINVAESFVVTIGGLWIILAVYYLTNG